jgi:biopolymer transport protein ExbD
MAITTGNSQTASINMTPMIDILLVLLIIFMAIAPATPVGLEATVPHPDSPAAQPRTETPVLLEIAGDGGLRVNAHEVSAGDLAAQLISVFERRGDKVLFVKAAGELEFSTIAAALDTAHGVNIERVVLVR